MKVVAIGDSITYGFPYTPDSAWGNLVNKELGIPIINKGVNGDTSAGMLARFSNDVVRCSPSHVIIMGGTNDACAGVAAEEVYDNISRMVDLAVQNGIIPIIGIPIPCNYSKDERILGLYRADMREYGMANNICMIDFYSAFMEAGGRQTKLELYADVLHPNEEGYRVMAKVALNLLKDKISAG
ncbi:GDSL-type esterase/lipase family protein [Sporomusa malonica]|uniref:Lysophospholipase L1 n=1 Tax=Sporomusa malonica TaxID=112901 RepID=A0A1W2BPW9_9FIRM|nr:GDSL-type esterase/lipase family protein [Sporomusa malonica]SMC74933.1 Lysophospholipase L1 [Sporomusa malonica]